MSNRVLRLWPWLVAGLVALYVAAHVAIEPMRWRLPIRYLVQPFDIYREGFNDHLMCMRVELSPGEARDFAVSYFPIEERVSLDVPRNAELCPADFWPPRLSEKTLGFNGHLWQGEFVDGSLGSTGAVYQDGYLYFWSNGYPAV